MSEHSVERDAGVLAPRCPRCNWQVVDRLDTPEGRTAAKADVIQHKAECAERCRACREGVPSEIAPCLCVLPPGA